MSGADSVSASGLRPPVARAASISRVIRASASYWVLSIVAAGLLLYLPYLGQKVLSLEEGRRAFQAIAILDGGSWWRLDVGGQPYVSKPPLKPWLIALSSFVTGGVNEWALRLPSVIAAVVGALASGGLARLLVDDPERRNLASLAAGLAFLCTPSILERTRIGETDLLVTGSVGLAVWAFAAALARERLSVLAWIGTWAGVAGALALAALAKGPVLLAFAAAPIFVSATVERPRSQTIPALLAFLLALVPLATWAFINMRGNAGAIWIHETRVANVSMLLSARGLLSLLYLNEVPRWLLGMAPWVLFAAAYVWRERRHAWRRPILRLVLVYAIPVSVAILLWPGARGRYALPAIVPVAALAGAAVAVYWDRAPVRRAFLGLVAVMAAVALLLATVLTGRGAAQRERRADIADFARLIEGRAGGRIYALEPADLNLLAYAGRTVTLLRSDPPDCPSERDILIASSSSKPSGWQSAGPIGKSGLAAFAPKPDLTVCRRPPAAGANGSTGAG